MVSDNELSILEQLNEISGKLGAVEKDTSLLRAELLGNGQPGRMRIAEDAIQTLQEQRKFQQGVLYSLNAAVAILVAVLAAHGASIWHFFFPPKH